MANVRSNARMLPSSCAGVTVGGRDAVRERRRQRDGGRPSDGTGRRDAARESGAAAADGARAVPRQLERHVERLGAAARAR